MGNPEDRFCCAEALFSDNNTTRKGSRKCCNQVVLQLERPSRSSKTRNSSTKSHNHGTKKGLQDLSQPSNASETYTPFKNFRISHNQKSNYHRRLQKVIWLQRTIGNAPPKIVPGYSTTWKKSGNCYNKKV